MSNKITEKYFTQKDFSKNLTPILKHITYKTGFCIGQEIWRGLIYDNDKVGSIIFSGKYKSKPAILKIQGLKPELDEIDIYRSFSLYNKSTKIRLPSLYASHRWNKRDGFGYLIQEPLTGKPIFKMPLATQGQINSFASFYNEYRTKTVVRPFWKTKIEPQKFFTSRLNNWIKICQHKKLWDTKEMASRVEQFKKLISATKPIPFVFSHGHLTANDIYQQNNQFMLLSNLFWSWRPKYYDLAFNIWACLLKLPPNTPFKKALRLINDWEDAYKTIPWVKKQNDFDKLFSLMLFERLIGSIVVDLGITRRQSTRSMKLWKLHLKLFDSLAAALPDSIRQPATFY